MTAQQNSAAVTDDASERTDDASERISEQALIFFTRRAADVVSEACFTSMTGDRHDKRAAMDFSMIIFAQTL